MKPTMNQSQPENDDAKMRELILYVAQLSWKDERFGAVKLNKILFYADFIAFVKRGKSITGQKYFALDEGPAPKRLVPIREKMKKAGDIAIQKVSFSNFPQERVVALRAPKFEILNDAEGIAIVNSVVQRLRNMSADEVSEESHRFAGWQIAYERGAKTEMPYSLAVFDFEGLGIPTPALPQNLVDYGKQLYRRISDASSPN